MQELEATGYGLLYLTRELMKCHGMDMKDKICCVSGSGNVAIYAVESTADGVQKLLPYLIPLAGSMIRKESMWHF